MPSIMYILIALGLIAGVVFIIRKANASHSDTKERLVQLIEQAEEFDDLVFIAGTWSPAAFGEKEVAAFEARADELLRADIRCGGWRRIYSAILDDEDCPLTVLARERAKKEEAEKKES